MQKIKRVSVLLCVLFLFGCGDKDVAGTYYNVANNRESIELKSDGQFHLKAGAMELTGKYVVEGKTIVLNPESKMAARGTLEKGLIIDNDGTRWKKK